jgi:hypothetical protein
MVVVPVILWRRRLLRCVAKGIFVGPFLYRQRPIRDDVNRLLVLDFELARHERNGGAHEVNRIILGYAFKGRAAVLGPQLEEIR